MGSLLDACRAEATPPGPACGVRPALDVMSKEDRSDIEAALADPSIPSSAIYRALRAAGHQPGTVSILRRHRKGECACGRAG